MNTKEVEDNKKQIQEMGLHAIKEYFNIDLEQLDNEILKHLHNRAKIGMQFEREMAVSKRAIEMNYLRVFKMVAEDKKELRQFVKKSLPQYSPI